MNASNPTDSLRKYFYFGFPLSGEAWRKLDISALLRDNPDATEFTMLRLLALAHDEEIAGGRDRLESLSAAHLLMSATIVDILRYVLHIYCLQQIDPAIPRALKTIAAAASTEVTTTPPPTFVDLFPPHDVHNGLITNRDFLTATDDSISGNETAVREMVLLSLITANRAFGPARPLHDDTELRSKAPYTTLVQSLEKFFEKQPPLKELDATLFACLRAPMIASPDSLEGQLNYIREHWSNILPLYLQDRILTATDIFREEQRMRGLGPGPSEALSFVRQDYAEELEYPEPARFSRDSDWMSNAVIIAKSVYVWLDQLSKKYKRHIKQLNEIPDEELDQLARWGFSGLWLIGLWERSTASQTIKEIMGNPEAAASAYSLYDYTIASDLGGEEGYLNLSERAGRRGIRLASDMVPNHMGVFSRWIIEHPDWFVQLDYPPFPVYRFTGTDLSSDDRVAIQIEDGYYDHRDAAVVFKRTDKHTGDEKYIYHGNDGTSMPWNDTAQLNFMLPEVREAVIQTILHVARLFPIIRFDAAMTLAKKHYQRLWFPRHGDGGAIPSRAEHGMSKSEFDAVFPSEFWREVVDRVASEVPDTLLLAEAFWLMEGYFVRTLGMHRVYNSAFMNMLKLEDNASYRTTIKNVLEFSPEILKRFVNFMNNPDEATAIEQFGQDDKYFGVAVLMVTMPGLPMFGHGQIEGLTEKYGMEYRRAYWDETADSHMIERHEREIFPLMQRRHIFSGATHFALFDFNTPEGHVDENVFAYTNRNGDERAVILYNNSYHTTSGRIHHSTQINVSTDDDPFMARRSLAEALDLKTDDKIVYSFRDHCSGLEYLRTGRQLAEEGLFALLHGYQYHAFLDFAEISDGDGRYRQLSYQLNGGGVPSIAAALARLQLEPVITPYKNLLREIMNRHDHEFLEEQLAAMLNASAGHLKAEIPIADGVALTAEELKSILNYYYDIHNRSESGKVIASEKTPTALTTTDILPCIAAAIIAMIARASAIPPSILIDDWLLGRATIEVLSESGSSDHEALTSVLLIRAITSHASLLDQGDKSVVENLREALTDPNLNDYLQVNTHDETTWLSKERLESLLSALIPISLARQPVESEPADSNHQATPDLADQILEAARKSEYRLEEMMVVLEENSISE